MVYPFLDWKILQIISYKKYFHKHYPFGFHWRNLEIKKNIYIYILSILNVHFINAFLVLELKRIYYLVKYL